MATKLKTVVNKAEVIRQAFAKLGMDATAKQIQEFGATQGAPGLATAQISNIKMKLKKAGGASGSTQLSQSNEVVNKKQLFDMRRFAANNGGVENCIEQLGLLRRLVPDATAAE
jgi:hypothetical protein